MNQLLPFHMPGRSSPLRDSWLDTNRNLQVSVYETHNSLPLILGSSTVPWVWDTVKDLITLLSVTCCVLADSLAANCHTWQCTCHQGLTHLQDTITEKRQEHTAHTQQSAAGSTYLSLIASAPHEHSPWWLVFVPARCPNWPGPLPENGATTDINSYKHEGECVKATTEPTARFRKSFFHLNWTDN